MLARQIVIKMYNYHAFFVTRSLQHSQQDIQFFLYHVDLVVYVIQRIMIVQVGPAFLQFP